MTWRDRLTDASFRGVPFKYERVDGQEGRDTVVKKVPGAADPIVEDVGPGSTEFTIEMFVIGPEYDRDRDALRKAFNTPGPGELRHPYWGNIQVTVTNKPRFTESTKLGGMARTTVNFVKTSKKLRLLDKVPTKVTVTVSAAALKSAAQTQFAGAFAVANAISDVADTAVEAVQAVATAVSAVRGKIAAAMLVFDAARAAIDDVVTGVVDLINTPVDLANAITDMIDAVAAGVTSIEEAFEDVADFFDGEEELPSEGNILAERARVIAMDQAIIGLGALESSIPALADSTAQQQSIKLENRAALVRLVKASSIGAVSTTAMDLVYESYDQAQNTRELITDMVDDLLEDDDLGDELYGPLTDLRAAVVEHFAATANSLPELKEYTPKATLPALVLAYQLYGDADRETELLARNPSITDPSAVRSGQPIKVIVDA